MRSFKSVFIACLVAVILIVVARWLLRMMLRAVLRVRPDRNASLTWRDRLLLRYQDQDMQTWMFCLFKTRLDPMFIELREFLKATPNARMILDLGCGFGFAGSFVLDCLPAAEIYAIEPSAARVHGATRAFAERGHVFHAAAPDFEIPGLPERFDAIFFLDVLHFLSDPALELTLRRVRGRLGEGGILYLRAPMKPAGFGSVIFNMDRISRIAMRSFAHFRSEEQLRDFMTRAGLSVMQSHRSGGNPELVWFIAKSSVAMEGREAAVEPVSAPQDEPGRNQN